MKFCRYSLFHIIVVVVRVLCSVLRIRIRDPVLFTPWIRDPDPG
jgi:hypothetical protein